MAFQNLPAQEAEIAILSKFQKELVSLHFLPVYHAPEVFIRHINACDHYNSFFNLYRNNFDVHLSVPPSPFCFLYVVVNVRCNRLLLILYLPRLKRKCQWDHGICARYGHLCRESPLHFFASVWQPFCKLP